MYGYGTESPTFGDARFRTQRGEGIAALTEYDATMDHLTAIKCLSQAYTEAALEASDPHARRTFMEYSRQCLDAAHRVWRQAHQRGWYPVLPAPREAFIEAEQHLEAMRRSGEGAQFQRGEEYSRRESFSRGQAPRATGYEPAMAAPASAAFGRAEYRERDIR